MIERIKRLNLDTWYVIAILAIYAVLAYWFLDSSEFKALLAQPMSSISIGQGLAIAVFIRVIFK